MAQSSHVANGSDRAHALHSQGAVSPAAWLVTSDPLGVERGCRPDLWRLSTKRLPPCQEGPRWRRSVGRGRTSTAASLVCKGSLPTRNGTVGRWKAGKPHGASIVIRRRLLVLKSLSFYPRNTSKTQRWVDPLSHSLPSTQCLVASSQKL